MRANVFIAASIVDDLSVIPLPSSSLHRGAATSDLMSNRALSSPPMVPRRPIRL